MQQPHEPRAFPMVIRASGAKPDKGPPPGEFRCSADMRIRAAEGDGKKLPTIEIDAYNGGPMSPYGWYGYPIIIDVEGLKARTKELPLLKDHDETRPVGHASEITIEKGKVRLSGVLSGDNASTREIINSSANGFPWRASIGVRLMDSPTFIAEGDKAEVNGRTALGPVYIARKSEMFECSIVAIPADASTKTRVAAKTAQTGGIEMDFEKWLRAKGWDHTALTDDQRNTLLATYKAEQAAEAAKNQPAAPPATVQASGAAGGAPAATPPASPAGPDPVAELRAKMADETDRIRKVTTATEGHPDIRATAIRENWSPEKTELEVLKARVNAGGGAGTPGIIVRQGARLTAASVAAAALLTFGLSGDRLIKQGIKEEDVTAAEVHAGMGLQRFLVLAGRAAGVALPDDPKSRDFMRAAFGSHEISGITSNVINKLMLAAYQADPAYWRDVAAVRPVSNYHPFHSYTLSSDGTFEKVGPDGELKAMKLKDSTYTGQADTYGAIVTVSEKDVINDNIGALSEIPQLFGRSAAARINKVLFALLLSNPNNFFSVGNGNLLTGTTSRLTVTSGFDAGIAALRNIKGPDGNPANTMPNRLLVPVALESAADRLYVTQTITNVVDSNGGTETYDNVHRNKYRPIPVPYLNASFGGSDTAWYIMADPAVRAAMEVRFLNGVQTPVVERVDVPSEYLAMRWRGRIDFGVAMGDPAAIVKSTGAA